MDQEFEDENLEQFYNEYQKFLNAITLFYENCVIDTKRCHVCTLQSLIEQSFTWQQVLHSIQNIRSGQMNLERMVVEFLIASFYFRFGCQNPTIVQKHGTLLFHSLQMNSTHPEKYAFKVFSAMINLFFVELFEKILDKIVEDVYNTNSDVTQIHTLVDLYLEPLLNYCYAFQHQFDEKTKCGKIIIQKVEQNNSYVEDKPLEFCYSM